MTELQRQIQLFGGEPPPAVLAELLGRAVLEEASAADPEPPAPAEPAMASEGLGGYRVPAGTTISSILDDQYGLGLPPIFSVGNRVVMSRELAATYAAVYRCVSLLSGVMAGLMTSNLRVINSRTRETITAANRTCDIIMESPNGETPGVEWWEDFFADYMLDGNALAVVERRSSGRLDALRLLRPWDAYALDTPDGPVYTAHPDDERGAQVKASYRDIVHSRWARLSSRGAVRRHFALAPIAVLSRAIGLGIEADQHVYNYFSGDDGGAKGKIAVVYPESYTVQEDQRRQIAESLAQYRQGRDPLVLMGGPKITEIKDSPQDADALKLRQFQVAEIGRVFGVPAPLLGVEVTQWGSGIEQLSRLLYRFGAKQHLQRALASLSIRLLPRGQRFAVDETDLLRGDSKATADLLSKLLGGPNGPAVISIAEARHLLGFDIDTIPDQLSYTAGESDPPDDEAAAEGDGEDDEMPAAP